MSKWRRRLHRLLWIGVGLVGMLGAVYLVMLGLMWRWVAQPPVLTTRPAILSQTNQTRGSRVCLGPNWFDRRDGLPVLYLTGGPFEMGYANAALTQAMIRRQEDTILGLLERAAPYRWMQFLLKFFVTYKNRHLSDHIPLAYRLEMYGLTRGCPDPHPEVGPAYHRVLNYHAAQDISYMLMNSPLLRGGCTGFAAWGSHTRDGHLLVGRNFDWEPAPVFDEERVLIVCEPDEGIPFVSLAWAGMVGCVSAMNREGLAIFVNGAPSELPAGAGTPTCIVARDVVQHARTIAEATGILGRYQVFVSAMFLVASHKDGRAVVIEKTPEQMAVREAVGTPWIICANHYMTATLTNAAVNQKYVHADTSLSRYARMSELLAREAGHLDTPRAAALLRDRLLPGDRAAGNGHRSALNPLIATHAVIMDLTEGTFWAARPPHQLGQFIAFDPKDPEKSLPTQAVAADPMLAAGYETYISARTSLSNGWRALKKSDLYQANVCAESAERSNPGLYDNTWLRAEALFRQGKRPEAAQACREALQRSPARAAERRRIEQLLGQSEARK